MHAHRDANPHHSGEEKTLRWWALLKGLATFNLALWMITAFYLGHQGLDTIHHLTGWHLALSGLYTLACAFRSYLPRIDLERYVLSDRFASSMVFGRSAATVAEISFAIQMKLFLDEIGGHAGLDVVSALSPIVVVSLSIAQVCCWSSVLTLNHLGHAIEEGIWGVSFMLIGGLICLCIPELQGTWWTIGVIGAMISWVYVIFMFTVDVPMYYRRWRQGQADKAATLSLGAGWHDALYRREYTRAWKTWRPEVMWLTGYFACAVWLSVGLSMLPR